MSRALVALLLLAVAGCTSWTPDTTPPNVREIAGAWQGRLALGGANAPASLTIREDGTFGGALHLEGGDRPVAGAIIVVASPGRLRYVGTLGEGTVVVTPRNGPPAALQFVPDGGGGGGSLTRAK